MAEKFFDLRFLSWLCRTIFWLGLFLSVAAAQDDSVEKSNQIGFSNATIPFISEALDKFIKDLFGEGTPVYDIFAAVAIIAGFVYVFFGAKLERITSFIAGFIVGAVVAAVILEATGAQNSIPNSVWVVIFLVCGLLIGILAFCLAGLRKLIFGIALALIFMGLIIYFGLGEAIGNNYVLLALAIVVGLIFVYLGYKAAGIVSILFTTLLGGALMILGIGHFTGSIISLNTLTSDPAQIAACTNEACLIPLIIGAVFIILGLLFQTRRYRKKKKKQEQDQEARVLLNQMREYRENMEARFAELDDLHKRELEEIQEAQEAKQTETLTALELSVKRQKEEHEKAMNMLQRKLSAQEKDMLLEKAKMAEAQQEILAEMKRQQEAGKLELQDTLERELALKKRQEQEEQEKEELLRQLELEREELQAQLEQEKQNKVKSEEELLMEEEREREKREKEKEYREIDAIHNATLQSLQSEVQENRDRIKEYEAAIKEANRLAKRIRIPATPPEDEAGDAAHPAVAEVRERAIEFAKLKSLANKAREEQKQSLKQVKKALKEVETLSNELQKAKKKTTSPRSEEDMDEQQGRVDDLSGRMERARALLVRYEQFSNQYTALIQDLAEAVNEFRKAEKRLEAYDEYDLRLNVQEGIAIDDDAEDDVVRAEDILEGTVVRRRRNEERGLGDQQISFEFLVEELSKYVKRKVRRVFGSKPSRSNQNNQANGDV